MTMTELIQKLTEDENIWVSVNNGEIIVKTNDDHPIFSFPIKATNFTDFTFMEQIPEDYLGKKTGDYVASQIDEYLQTPIDQRFDKKEEAKKAIIKIRQEFTNVGEKVYRLEQFGKTEKYRSLPEVQKTLLSFQDRAMKFYMSVLSERINFMEKENADK